MPPPRLSHRLCSISALTATLALVAPNPGAHAATVLVTDCGDSGQPGQLRHAISTAGPGDTIQLPGCTVTLTGAPGEDANAGGDLDVTSTLIIRGLGRTATILDGGGVDRVLHVLPAATLTLVNLTIRNGQPPVGQAGGGILNAGALTLTNVSVSGNRTAGIGGDGGGIASEAAASLIATDVEVADNEAGGGGGGIDSRGALSLTRVRVVGNRATSQGGGLGVRASSAPVAMADSTIAGNSSGSGGGVEFRGGATGTITTTTIWGNAARNSGGGLRIVNSGTTLTLTNSTVAHNTADSDDGGGGFSITSNAAVTLVNATVARNADTSGGGVGGGGIGKGTGTLTLINTLVALNTAVFGSVSDVDPADVNAGTSNLIGGEPQLGPLQDNGGPTLTMAPFPGSPAIDAGSNGAAAAAGLTADQRGVTRVQDGDGNGSTVVDIGALEVEPVPGGLLAISPPSGTYLTTQRFDVVLILRAPGRTLVPAGGSATLDGTDVTARLAACLVSGVIPDGGQSFRCGALTGAGPNARVGLAPGPHILAVTIPFTDGSVVKAQATWEILATTE